MRPGGSAKSSSPVIKQVIGKIWLSLDLLGETVPERLESSWMDGGGVGFGV